jgi:hypothetical protein
LVATPDLEAASSVGGLAALLPLDESGVDAAGGPDCAPGLDGFFVATPACDAAASVGGLPALLLLSGDAVEPAAGAEADWAWAVSATLEHASSSAIEGGKISRNFVIVGSSSAEGEALNLARNAEFVCGWIASVGVRATRASGKTSPTGLRP